MPNTYLFYDLETSGLNHCFDQAIQFAAIRTDEKFHVLETHECDIRLNPEVILAPEALLTHGIGLDRLKQGKPEIEAMQYIHRLFNTPNTISLGYNTLGFDDEFLRFSFYRNLLPPYTHQFANGCSRMDVYPMAVLFYLFKPEVLRWPMTAGKVSLKLENLNAENGLAEGAAHDAMVDVKATLALAQKLADADPTMWAYLSGYFDKKEDIARGNDLPIIQETEDRIIREALMVQGKFGNKQDFIAPVISLGQHAHYKNQTLWLRLDTPELATATPDNFIDSTYVIQKKMGEPPMLLPPKTRYLKKLGGERQRLAADNQNRLLNSPVLLEKIATYYQQYEYPAIPHLDIDAALYTLPFPTRAEEAQFQRFHAASLEDKYQAASQCQHPIRREQALRLLTRHYPNTLPDTERLACLESLQDPSAEDYRGRHRLTAENALAKITALLKTPITEEQKRALLALQTAVEMRYQ